MEPQKLKRLSSLCDAFAHSASRSSHIRDPQTCHQIQSAPSYASLIAQALEKQQAAGAVLEQAKAAAVAALTKNPLLPDLDIEGIKEAQATSNRANIESIDLYAAAMLLGVTAADAATWIPEEFKNEQDAADLESLGAHTLAKLCRVGQRRIAVAM